VVIVLPRRIGIASRSQAVDLREIIKVAAALNVQANRDLQNIWNVSATVTALADPESIEPGVWPIFIVDDVGQEGASGLHLTDHKQPYALVQAGPTWSLTASHECLEMMVDPSGNRLVASSGITVEGGNVTDVLTQKFEYLVEVADPSEDPVNAYMIDEVLVSDFYTPHFFDPVVAPGVRYSFTGRLKRPREILSGGYISWVNPALGTMQQLRWFGTPEIVDLPGQPARSTRGTLRGFVDSQTHPPMRLSHLSARSPVVVYQKERARWLQKASTLRTADYALARQPTGSPATLPPPDAAQAVLNANARRLQVRGATKAYVGWHFQNNWITRQRAIVVLARRADLSAVENELPASIGGFPIDVRVDPRPTRSTPAAPTGMLVAAQSGTVREEEAVPDFPGEVVFEQPEPSLAALAAAARKRHVDYVPPAGVTLGPITAKMTLILHVSPEQGWAQLQKFFRGIAQDLVAGMYEFTAPHIESALISALRSPDKLTLTLDSPPEPANKREQTVEKTHDDLAAALKKRLSFAWALAGLGQQAPAEAFPTSYHIKVAVKDSKSFWLSSGNWNTSNQPNVDPADEAALAAAAHSQDRDWHVVCECPQLAKLFRAYLLQDYATAKKAAAAPAVPSAATMAAGMPVAVPVPEAALPIMARTPKTFFPAHTVTGTIKVMPLLTPHDYRKPVLDLIKNAQRRFYMQTQYIHPNVPAQDKGSPSHMELIAAVAGLINNGVDVRLITSEFQDHMWIERLQDAGVDAVEHLRIQPHVHNKGMVIDSNIVVVSSQNWSALGTGDNRDAGLIIYNADAAQYFEAIFLHDWVNMAAAKALR
jgi:phosphatidylserine/phosphatidylglycerophosphate/cardiolipin synthase-like enzyme